MPDRYIYWERSSYFKEITDVYLPSSRRSFAYQNTLIFNTKRENAVENFLADCRVDCVYLNGVMHRWIILIFKRKIKKSDMQGEQEQ